MFHPSALKRKISKRAADIFAFHTKFGCGSENCDIAVQEVRRAVFEVVGVSTRLEGFALEIDFLSLIIIGRGSESAGWTFEASDIVDVVVLVSDCLMTDRTRRSYREEIAGLIKGRFVLVHTVSDAPSGLCPEAQCVWLVTVDVDGHIFADD